MSCNKKYIDTGNLIGQIFPVLITLVLAISSLPLPVISEENSVRSTIATELPVELDYAIITTSDLQHEFEDLKEWRSITGYRTDIFLLDGPSGILLTYSGRDDAEKLFNFIGALHETTNGSLKYILLGGDDDKVPIRYLHANASRWDYDDGYLSDVYYSSPDTEWDMDSDGRYGEREDLEAFGVDKIDFALRVGRFPVSTADEARIMVEKIVEYESSPVDGPWTEKAVVASSLMEAPNLINDPETPEDEGFDNFKDNGYKAFINYTYRYIPRSIDLVEYHDHAEYEGGNYSNATDGLDIGDIPSALNDGCSFFAFAGQSFYDTDSDWDPPIAYSLAQYMDPNGLSSGGEAFAEALTYEDCENLTNGNKLPVAYISSCDSANFSSPGDTSLESIVRSPGGGAICLIGSSGVSWRGEGTDYSLGNWYLLSRFLQRTILTGRPGDSLYWLKQDYLNTKWNEYATKEVLLIELYAYNLLGDPALAAWIGSPIDINLTITPSDHYAGGDSLEARVTDVNGNPLSMVKVSVFMNDTDEVFSAFTGPDGMARVPTSFSSGGNITVTATGRNLVPSISGSIVSDEPMDLSIVSDSLTISPLPLTEGETASFNAMIENDGGRPAENVEVFLMTGDVIPDPLSWTDHVANITLDLQADSEVNVEFNIEPSRSWKKLSLGIRSSGFETDLTNNLASIRIDVNARPRFIPSGPVELEEDEEGPVLFDLTEMVYDPDNDHSTLIFTLGTGSPSWCSVSGKDLVIDPPGNWSGTFDLTVRVSDGLSNDLTEITVLVNPVNDAPVLLNLKDSYTAMTDTPFSIILDVLDIEGDEVMISVHSDLPRLTINGRTLGFVPYSEDMGLHNITLNISDPHGGNRSYDFNLEITGSSGLLYFKEPSIHLPSARVGERYVHLVDVGGDLAFNASFSDDSDLFDIDPVKGEISFKPVSEDRGEHWITVTISSGNTTIERTFLLDIKEKEENDPMIYWILAVVILILLLLVIVVLAWSGPRLEQYGLEE